MSGDRPYVICISGLDPSGGAGLLADIKTLEMHRVQGLGICSALTFQNENAFHGLEWVNQATLFNQLDALLELYHPQAVKIGIIENLPLLSRLVRKLKELRPQVQIVWDPVLKASAGFDFHPQLDTVHFLTILENIDLLTPNLPESESLFGSTSPDEIARKTNCPVLLKGGHSTSQVATDTLIYQGETIHFQHEKKTGYSKHGTGCILSSSIAANLALGNQLPEACLKAKEYIQPILSSNTTRLAYHYE